MIPIINFMNDMKRVDEDSIYYDQYKIIDCPVCGGDHVQSFNSSSKWSGLKQVWNEGEADIGIEYQRGTDYYKHVKEG